MKENIPHTDEANCPVKVTMDVIGGKWKPIILYYIKTIGVCRFGELQRYIPHITKKMLTQQLRELEADGILNRRIYEQMPPKVEYTLSDYGKTLKPILQSMADWGTAYQLKSSASIDSEENWIDDTGFKKAVFE